MFTVVKLITISKWNVYSSPQTNRFKYLDHDFPYGFMKYSGENTH